MLYELFKYFEDNKELIRKTMAGINKNELPAINNKTSC